MGKTTKYIIVITAALILYGCAPASRFPGGNLNLDLNAETAGEVRVLLLETYVGLSMKFDFAATIMNRDREITDLLPGDSITITARNNRVRVRTKDMHFEIAQISIVPDAAGEVIPFENSLYRGRLQFLNKENQLLTVNVLPLEEYLYGVVPLEMGKRDSADYFEALKAAAVGARTYAIMKMIKQNEYYDVTDDTRDQVYGGAGVERALDNSAVDETRGLIITYRGEPAYIFYHSTCGGITEDVRNVFTSAKAPYLISQQDGVNPNCSVSPSFKWTETYTPQQIRSFLLDAGLIDNINDTLLSLSVVEKFESGRVKELRVELEHAGIINIESRKIRGVFRRNDNGGILRSLLFTVALEKEAGAIKNIIIEGRGNGHGVGMCQWGALYLSSIGKNFEEILEFYFPTTELRDINDYL